MSWRDRPRSSPGARLTPRVVWALLGASAAGAEAVRAIDSARSAGGSLLATGLGVVTLLFGLWGVFGELQDALNTIWGVTTPPGRGLIGIISEPTFRPL